MLWYACSRSLYEVSVLLFGTDLSHVAIIRKNHRFLVQAIQSYDYETPLPRNNELQV